MIFAEAVLKSRSGKSVLDAGVEVTADNIKTFAADPHKVKEAVKLLKEKGFGVYSVGKSSITVGATAAIYQAILPKVRLIGVETGMSEAKTPVVYVRAIPVNADPVALFKKDAPSLLSALPGDTVISLAASTLHTLLAAFVLCQPEVSDAGHDWTGVKNGVDRNNKPTTIRRELLPPDIPKKQLDYSQNMAKSYTGKNVEIIIVDTGCSSDHPFFRKQTNTITVTTIPEIERILNDKVTNQQQVVNPLQQQLAQARQDLQTIETELQSLRQNPATVTAPNASEHQLIQRLVGALAQVNTTSQGLRTIKADIEQTRSRMKSVPENDIQRRKPLIKDLVRNSEIKIRKEREVQSAEQRLLEAQQSMQNYRNSQNLQSLQAQQSTKQSQISNYSNQLRREQVKLTDLCKKLSNYLDVNEDINGHGTAMVASACVVAPQATINLYKKANHIDPGNQLVWNLMQRTFSSTNTRNNKVISCSWSKRSTKDANLHQITGLNEMASLWSRIPILFAAGNQSRADFSIQAQIPQVISVGGAWREDDSTINGSTTTKTYFTANSRRVPDVCGWCENRNTSNLLSPVDLNTNKPMLTSNRNPNPNRGWRKMNGGSSSATAQVAGLCAIIKQHWPEATPEDIKVLLVTEAVPVNAGHFAADNQRDADIVFDALGPVGLISITRTMAQLFKVNKNGENQGHMKDAYLKILQDIFAKKPQANPSQ